jgi:glucokinase
MKLTKVKSRVVGIDIGVAVTTYAVVDLRGNIIAQESFSTRDYPNLDNYLAVLCENIVTLVEANGGYESIRSVGVCCPSSNFLTGCIENAPNLQWKGVIPLAAMMRDRLGLAVALTNNAQCVALGEQAFGAAHGMKDFIVITLGHGMGSCIFSNRRMHLGTKGFAGEIGHNCIVPNGRQCGCGHQGCIEAYCAYEGLLRTARELMENAQEPSLMAQYEKLTPEAITECCEQGDALAIETYRRTGEMLGRALANYASLLNPEAIILTGIIPQAGKWLLDTTEKVFNDTVFHNIKGQTKIIVSTLKDGERDVLGASVLAWQVKEYSLFL